MHIRNRGKNLELEIKNQTRPGKEKEALDQARLFFFARPMINLYFGEKFNGTPTAYTRSIGRNRPGIKFFHSEIDDQEKLVSPKKIKSMLVNVESEILKISQNIDKIIGAKYK